MKIHLLGVAVGASLLALVSSARAAPLETSPSLARGTAFHTEVHPPHWTQWTSDGQTAITGEAAFLTHGLRCWGRYCDDVSLLQVESGYTPTKSWWTDAFSEEGNNERVCADNGFVTGLGCSGDYCDSITLRCSQLNNGGVRSNCYWTEGVSEEGGGTFVAPESTYIAGMRCSGRYCDSKQLYLCQADNGGPVSDLSALAKRHAPRLRFDQEFSTGSGEQSKCFPSDAATYFTQRAQGASSISLCNKDPATVRDNRVPIYYVANQVGTNTVLLRYWYFYAWQSTCFVSAGSHAADWESMAALLVDGQLKRVAFYQHGGWYSREAGAFEIVDGTHPIAYIGKNAHGSFHDAGGSGGCLYFEDYRNPGGNDYRLDTWNNLIPLTRGSGSPAWMNCTGSGCFDGIGHPLEQTGDLRTMRGCGKDGCGRSSVDENLPFQNDPTGADHTTLTLQHSGKGVGVPGASTGDGVNLTQFPTGGANHARWLLESTGDGHFTLRARHSGKCMDVTGASKTAGANVIQQSCSGNDNQRFRLLPSDNGTFTLQAKHSGQCLGISGGSLAEGALLVQSPCGGTTHERFRFAP
ncbi:MAG: RICIN domain-containing protein [Cystobacter sp.]